MRLNGIGRVLVALFGVMLEISSPGQSIICAVCGQPIKDQVYLMEDKVTGGPKKSVCEDCSRLTKGCYLCGMPVRKNFRELSDQRILCERDAKSVVLDESETIQIAKQVKDSMDHWFSRFTTFSDDVTVRLADRVDIVNLYHVPGNDFDCPNVLGYTQRETNGDKATYTVSLLSGLLAPQLRATAAHEWAHTWIFENVSLARQKKLHTDAREGFCELVSYLLMESQREAAQLDVIRSNAYTRGQILLFIDAERRFGFNDIVDWMKYGVDSRLRSDALDRVREVEMPARKKPATWAATIPTSSWNSPTLLANLTLQGIMWSQTRPTALINGRTFSVNEEAKVRLSSTNLTVRCMAVHKDSVVVKVGDSSELRTLKLK